MIFFNKNVSILKFCRRRIPGHFYRGPASQSEQRGPDASATWRARNEGRQRLMTLFLTLTIRIISRIPLSESFCDQCSTACLGTVAHGQSSEAISSTGTKNPSTHKIISSLVDWLIRVLGDRMICFEHDLSNY